MGCCLQILSEKEKTLEITTDTPSQECSICLREFEGAHLVSVLGCDLKHVYHASCISEWQKVSGYCPLCMQETTRGDGIECRFDFYEGMLQQ